MKNNGAVVEVKQDYLSDKLAKFLPIKEDLEKVADVYMGITVKDPSDTENYNKAREALSVSTKLGTRLESIRVELKKEFLEGGRRVDSDAKMIDALIQPMKKHLRQQVDIVDKEQERLENERLRQAKEKQDERVDTLLTMGMTFDPRESKYKLNELSITHQLLGLMEQEAFDQFAMQVQKESEIIALKQAEIDRLAKEELEKQAKIKAEQEAKQKELDKIAEEQAKERAEIDRQKREIELENAKRKAAEDALKQAEIDRKEKAEREEKERIEKELKAKEDAERAEALKPDKKKLLELATTIKNIPMPEIKQPNAKKILTGTVDLLNKVQIYIKNQTAELK